MSLGKLIVIDGIDGSGKATQTRLLFRNLQKYKIKSALLSLPVYDSFSGELIARYLRNEFGRIDPHLAAMLYAANRFQQKEKILNWLKEGRVVVLNRYVTANQIHQAAHLKRRSEREKFVSWIAELEYEVFGLPKPDLVILINLPVEVSYQMVRKKPSKERKYVFGSKGDLLESDLEHQTEAAKQALEILKTSRAWQKIEAVEKGKLLAKEIISKKIWAVVSRFIGKT